MTEVYLAIYDLSQGMARSLSSQFLGPQYAIDMIPHTALLVYGKEYYFGGGIQCVDPQYFRSRSGLYPIKTELLGTTRVTKREFDVWCRQQESTKYNMATYDLLHCNCNHFSHEAALKGLQLSNGVPSWILQVPQRFLASPMGQLVRPILEQMQITQISPVQAPQPPPPPSSSNDPLPSSSSMAFPPPVSARNSVPSKGSGSCTNPWADVTSCPNPMPATTNATPTTGTTSAAVSKSRPITPPLSSNTESILNKYTKPMLSNDTQSVTLCISKLSPHLSTTARVALATLANHFLQTRSSKSSTTHPQPLLEAIEVIVPELWNLIQDGKVISFTLLLLRLVVLDFTTSKVVETCMTDLMQALSVESSCDGDTPDCQKEQLFATAASKSLAWCVASNYTGSHRQPQRPLHSPQSQPLITVNYTTTTTTTTPATATTRIPSFLVEAAIRDWNHDSVQVRQAACTFLYNFVIGHGQQLEQDEETVVSLVCSSLESLVEETDPTTRLRRLLVGARVVFGVHYPQQQQQQQQQQQHIQQQQETMTSGNSTTTTTRTANENHAHSIEHADCNEMAKDLIQDLGFVSLLQELATTNYKEEGHKGTTSSLHDSIECQQLALELMERFHHGHHSEHYA